MSHFTQGSYRVLISWKRLEICPWKSLENRDHVWKNGEKSWVFSKLQQVLCMWIFFSFWSQMFFNLACTFAVHCKKSPVLVFFKASLDHLLDDPESGKRNYCFGKGLGKVLGLESKNLYKPCTFKGFCDALTLPSKYNRRLISVLNI